MEMRMRSRALLLVAVMLCAPTVHARPQAHAGSVRTVLVIHSGAESFPANPTLDAGIREALTSRPDVPIDYYAEYLEADLFPGEQAALAFADYIRRKYQGRRVDVVIAMTSTGLRFVLDQRRELFPDAPIVFFGVVRPDENTRRAGGGITGITTGVAYGETLKLALALHPSTKRVFVVARGQAEQTDSSVRAELSAFSRTVSLTYLNERTVPDLLAAVKAIPAGSFILYVWHSQPDSGNLLYPNIVARLVADAAAVPVYGTSDIYIGTGVVGGVVRSGRQTGNRIGEMALRILTGTRAQDIPIEDARVGPVIDWRQVQRWGIPRSRLPAASQILFREPSAWEGYKVYIVGVLTALLAQAALIAGLFIQMARRRAAERQVQRGQEALRKSYERVRDLGLRLLSAQESERSRLAMELHDDISQKLTMLNIELMLLGRKIQSSAEVSAVEAAVKLTEGIATSVHDLSHRLHPARLQLIGLVDALEGLQAEMARSDMTIAFAHENIPSTLAPALELCLFRIAQEALQNALKHSHARRVSIELSGKSGGIELTIVDDGVGFNVDGASSRGLGLLSVEERVDAVGGTLEIRSSPGEGTTLKVTVPFSGAHDPEAVAV
jgi:signal transduction histidine kinase